MGGHDEEAASMSESEANPETIISEVDDKISLVRTRSYDFSFNELADMYDDEELIIDPEFQRLFRWTEGAQSRFIESLLLELPIPPIFLIERQDRVYELIDGLQRFSSYLAFRGRLREPDGSIREPLVLSECDIVPEMNGKAASDLPRALDIKLKRSYVRAEILQKESDARLRYHMFKRLNTGGEQLSDQEIRNATIRLLSTDFNDFIVNLSIQEDYKYCIGTISESARSRRYDQELVLRFFAFKNNRAAYRHDLADFMTEYMEAVSDSNDETQVLDYDAERKTFMRTFEVLRAISVRAGLDEKVFGSFDPRSSKIKDQFGVYHFEGLTLGIQSVLDRIDLDDSGQLDRLADVVITGKRDAAFLTHTGGGKNDAVPLRERIQYFERRFEGAVS